MPGSFKLQCHLIADPEAGKVLTYHLVLENADKSYKEALMYYQKHLSVQGMIRFYVDICPSYL